MDIFGVSVKRNKRGLVLSWGIKVITGLDFFLVGQSFVVGVFWVGNLDVSREGFDVSTKARLRSSMARGASA